jgi:hypothetical protein
LIYPRRNKVRKYLYAIAGLIVIFMLSSCAGVISFRGPNTARSASVAADNKPLPPVKFEDFENGTLNGPYGYGNTGGGASVTYAISQEKPHSGQYCAKAAFNTGTNSDWGCGFGSGSTYGPYIDASGRNAISLWVKCPEGKTFYVFINESGANGADGEFWNSPDQTGAGDWKEYVIPFDEFFRNIYSGVQDGDYTFDASGLGTVGAQLGGNQGKGDLYIDDITFIKKM